MIRVEVKVTSPVSAIVCSELRFAVMLKSVLNLKCCSMKNKIDPNRVRVKIPAVQKEIPYGDSQTVPDDALSVKDFLTRFTLGTAPSIGVNPIYLDGEHDDEDMDAFARMDFAEREEVITQVMTDVASAKVEYEKAIAVAKAAKELAGQVSELKGDAPSTTSTTESPKK